VQEWLDVARKREIPFQALLASLGRTRATADRVLKPIFLIEIDSSKCSRAAHPTAVSPEKVAKVVKVLNSERFVDKAPQAIFNVLLHQVFFGFSSCDACDLEAHCAVAERRYVAGWRSFAAPELRAT
jgi:hypothetical protein